MVKHKSTWMDLYNCLYVVSSRYEEVSHLESREFELFDELDTSILMGLRPEGLYLFLLEGWIDEDTKRELESFRTHLRNIEATFWSSKHFDTYEDWELARAWSNQLMKKLGMDRKGWGTAGDIVIYQQKNYITHR